MPQTRAYAAVDPTTPLGPTTIERREVGPSDVKIDIEFCGVCHSDLHTARNEWGNSRYPVVPGHEIIGTVAQLGPDVTKFRVGDRIGVGCMVDSCGECQECRDGLEQYCRKGMVGTYNGRDSISGGRTFGGYSKSIVVTDRFVVTIPDSLDPAKAAPILCAGVTMYSPLKHHNVGPGSTVAVVGFGGLGSMAVKLATALGADVTVVSRSERKADEAKRAGATGLLVSTDTEQMKAAARSFDVVLSTVPSDHDMMPYLRLLKRDGAYVILGAIEPLNSPIHGGVLVGNRVSITGSLIGGIRETQEVLDFCGEHGIFSDIQLIPMAEINDVYEHLRAGDPGYRFVIDMATL